MAALDSGAVREYLLGERRAWVETACDCATATAAGWDGDATADRDRVVPPFRAALDRAGALAAAPDVLSGCVAAAGATLAADPVAGPPYVVVTGEGLLLRATLDTRLLVRVRTFTLRRGPDGPRYVRVGETPEAAVRVETTD
jgi:hypothetical protein